MNKNIFIFWSVLTVFLMLMIPNVSAIEYQNVINERKQNIDSNYYTNKFENIENIEVIRIILNLILIYTSLKLIFSVVKETIINPGSYPIFKFFSFMVGVFGIASSIVNLSELLEIYPITNIE